MTTTTIPVKTLQTDLIALQNIAAGGVVISSEFDFSSKMGGTIMGRFGRRSPSASTGSALFRLEASFHATANIWTRVWEAPTNYAAVESEAVSGTVNAGTNVITVASTTNLVATTDSGRRIFIDNGTPANSEFGIIKAVTTNTSITLIDNLISAATGLTLYNGAEEFSLEIPMGYRRIRFVVDGAAFTQAFAAQVSLITVDSYSAS